MVVGVARWTNNWKSSGLRESLHSVVPIKTSSFFYTRHMDQAYTKTRSVAKVKSPTRRAWFTGPGGTQWAGHALGYDVNDGHHASSFLHWPSLPSHGNHLKGRILAEMVTFSSPV
jgi:hypothetical protein